MLVKDCTHRVHVNACTCITCSPPIAPAISVHRKQSEGKHRKPVPHKRTMVLQYLSNEQRERMHLHDLSTTKKTIAPAIPVQRNPCERMHLHDLFITIRTIAPATPVRCKSVNACTCMTCPIQKDDCTCNTCPIQKQCERMHLHELSTSGKGKTCIPQIPTFGHADLSHHNIAWEAWK